MTDTTEPAATPASSIDTTDVDEGHTPEAWRRATAKAATLAEALPWLKTYHGKTIVVKYGGNAMTDEGLKKAFAEDIVFLRYAGFHPVVVSNSTFDGLGWRMGMSSEDGVTSRNEPPRLVRSSPRTRWRSSRSPRARS